MQPESPRIGLGHRVLALAVAAIAVVALAASGDTNEATTSDDADAVETNGGGASGSAQTFDVGDVVTLGGWSIVVNSVTDPFNSPNEFDTPTGRYVAIDATVTNNSSEPEPVSSLLCFELRDASGQNYPQAIVVGGGSAPDGEVDPGGILRGSLYYDVPAEVTDLQLRFKCDLLSRGSATINL
jgi:hypothetical protein